MYIETETTPNPEVLKFYPHLEGGVFNLPDNFAFRNRAEAKEVSPLAEYLFSLDGVKEVFLGQDFISVMKDENQQWGTMKALVISAIIDHFGRGGKILAVANQTRKKKEVMFDPKDAVVVEKIEELIDTRIRPAVARDGGNVVLEGFTDGVVYLVLEGACAGCPASTETLKMGIENMMKHFIPEVTEVKQAL